MSEQQNTDAESWRPVVGYEKLYEVSSFGRVRRSAPGSRTWVGRPVSSRLTRRGYVKCLLSSPGSVQKGHFVHRLVARAFLGSLDGLEVNHKDGDPTNNHLSNLEIVTRLENVHHALATGLTPVGEDLPQAKLTAAFVRVIREIYCPERARRGLGPTSSAIAKVLGVSAHTVSVAKSGQWWTRVSSDEPADPVAVAELQAKLAALPSSVRKVRNLSVDAVRELRRLRQEEGLTYSELMRRFGVSKMVVYKALTRQSFTHVD